MVLLSMLDANISCYEYTSYNNINYLFNINKKGIIILVSVVRRTIGRKYRKKINVDDFYKLRDANKYFDNYLKKLFIYNKNCDIIKKTIDEYCSKRELSNQYFSLIPNKIKCYFQTIFISLEILKVLESTYSLFPEPILEEFKHNVFIVLASLKQIILKVSFDVRGLVECITKRHFEYAFDELLSQLLKLSFI